MAVEQIVPIEQLAAEQFASQAPPFEIAELLQPLIESVKPIVGIASAVLGGLFGVYLIFVIIRLYYEHKKVRYLKNINYDLDYLNQHFNLPYSHQKKPLKFRKIMPLHDLKELEKELAEKIQEKRQKKLAKEKEKHKKKEA